MAYTTINKSTDYFNTKLYIGNTSARSIGGVGFQPDWVWFKNRSQTNGHSIFDAVRGATKNIISNSNAAESTSANGLTAFASDGFSIGTDGDVNGLGDDIVAWNWLANGAGSANTDGSTNSTVSVNTTAGFSIVKWTGTGANATIGHGLGAVPKMIIAKRLSNTEDWTIYHTSLGATKKIDLNNTGAESTVSNIWNNTTPTNSLFYVGDHGRVNASGDTYIAYCFAEKTGYSKFGSYTGNGNADGSFIYTGFKPQLVMLKQSSGTTDWAMNDIKRQQYNAQDIILYANSNGAESGYSGNFFDILSNGFKQRMSGSYYNGSGNTYIYMAFAQAPLVGSNGVTAKAR